MVGSSQLSSQGHVASTCLYLFSKKSNITFNNKIKLTMTFHEVICASAPPFRSLPAQQ